MKTPRLRRTATKQTGGIFVFAGEASLILPFLAFRSWRICTDVNKTLKVVLLFITPHPLPTTTTCCQCFASGKRLECKLLIISHWGLRGLRNFSNENFPRKAKRKKEKKRGTTVRLLFKSVKLSIITCARAGQHRERSPDPAWHSLSVNLSLRSVFLGFLLRAHSGSWWNTERSVALRRNSTPSAWLNLNIVLNKVK